jgi:hypothetical protein
MLTDNLFFDSQWNKTAAGAENDYDVRTLESGKVVIDRATGLMWQQSGSPEPMMYEKAQAYIVQLNRDRFGGFRDWRLPTLEEAMSLIEPKKSGDLHIDAKFDARQSWIWTSDTPNEWRVWCVSFYYGNCHYSYFGRDYYDVRAVRS